MENQQSQNLDQSLSLSKQDWLTLSFIKGVGPARLDRLLIYLQALEQDLSQPSHSLRESISYELLTQLKWPKETANEAMAYLGRGFISHEVSKKLMLTLSWLDESPLHHLIIKFESAYPAELAQISVAPLLLYVIGQLESLHQPKLAMVGARKATPYGINTAFAFAQQLAEHDISLVSGGAIGIDTAAHKGALDKSGRTIAVMGTGLLNLYPKINKPLFNAIIDNQGCLISEYPLQTHVQARLFPARNRIISGLSLGVIVVEAGFKSGSLISANYALQHNREVFAVPGRICDKASVACLDLIKQGAKLITHVDDILTEFPSLNLLAQKASTGDDRISINANNLYPVQNHVRQVGVSRETEEIVKLIPYPFDTEKLTGNELDVLDYIDKKLTDVSQKNEFELDQLVGELSLDITEIMQACMQLELEELLVPLMTGYARRLSTRLES